MKCQTQSLSFWPSKVPLVSIIMKSSVEISFPHKISSDVKVDYLEGKAH